MFHEEPMDRGMFDGVPSQFSFLFGVLCGFVTFLFLGVIVAVVVLT